jgi:hypothetical protein
MANKATNYSDFYKNNGADPTDTPDSKMPGSMGAKNVDAMTPEESAKMLRKKALKRRMDKMMSQRKMG